MALVVFLRGVNVGGHRTFRPSVLARDLDAFDVVNVGAAGTFVVRRPAPRAQVRAELLRRLPFDTHVALCDGREVLRLVTEDPFAAELSGPAFVRFVAVLPDARGVRVRLPAALPSDGEWLVRLLETRGRFALGIYRRHMRTIGYLGQVERLLGVPVTIRNWNTMNAVARVVAGTAGVPGATGR